jgi:hypothetical protein
MLSSVWITVSEKGRDGSLSASSCSELIAFWPANAAVLNCLVSATARLSSELM